MVSIVKIASAHQSPFGMTDSKDGEEGNVTNIFVSTAKLFHTFQDTMAMLLWSNAFSSLGHHSKT
jgi:hypothetical protein